VKRNSYYCTVQDENGIAGTLVLHRPFIT
jgi:hypothetical protein